MIALSSGESEFCGIVCGTATALGMKSMTRDHAHVVKVALETDSVSGRGMSLRLGAENGRHVDAQWLWVQAVVRRREATIRTVSSQEPATKQIL